MKEFLKKCMEQDKEFLSKLYIAVKGMRNSMSAHPDCVEGSEFKDMVNRVDEIL